MGLLSRKPDAANSYESQHTYRGNTGRALYEEVPSRRPALLGTVAASSWLVACGVYAHVAYGSLLSAATEIAASGAGAVGGVVAGISLPLVLISNWARSESRYRNLDRVIERRLSTLDKIQILPENTGDHMDRIHKTFEREGYKLKQSAAEMFDQLASLENRFSNQAHSMDDLSRGLAGRIDDMTRALDDQAARIAHSEHRLVELNNTLGDTNSHASQTAADIAEKLERPIESASTRMEAAASHVRAHVEELWAQLESLETAYSTTRTMAEEARVALSKETHDMRHVSDFATHEMEALSARLTPQIDLIEQMGRRASEKTSEMQDHINSQAHSLEKVSDALKMQGAALTDAVREQAEQLGNLQSKVDSFGTTISAQFRKQVDGLIEASETAGAQVVEQAEKGTEHLQAKLKAHTERLTTVTSEVNETVTDMMGRMDQRMDLLKETSTDLENTLNVASTKAADTLHQQLDTVVNTIEDRVDGIQTKAETMGEVVRLAGHDIEEHLEKSAAKLTASIQKSMQDMRSDTDDLAVQIKTVLDEKAESAGEIMDKRLETLDQALTKLSLALQEQEQGFGAAVEARLTDSSRVFERKLEDLRNAAGDLEDSMTGSADKAISSLVSRVDDFAEQVEDRLALVQDDTQSLRSTLDTTLVMLEDRTQRLNQTLDGEQSSLRETFETSVDVLMTQFVDRLQAARSLAASEADAINEDLSRLTDGMQSRLADTIDLNRKSIGDLSDDLDSTLSQNIAQLQSQTQAVKADLEDAVSKNVMQLQDSTQAVKGDLDKASEEAMAKLKSLVGSFETDLTSSSEQAMGRVIEMSRELPEIASQLGESAEQAVEKANLAGSKLDAQRMAIIGVADDLKDYGDRIRDDLKRIPEDMAESFKSLDTLVMSSTGDLKENFTDLETHIVEHGKSFDLNRERLSEHLSEFNRMYEQLQKYGHNISEVVGEQIASLTTSTDHAKQAWKDAREALESQAEAANAVSDDYIDRMAELSKRAKSDILELTQASDTALSSVEATADRVKLQLGSFTNTIGGLQDLIQSVGGVAEQHNALLKQSSQEAQIHTDALVQSLSQNQQDLFLRTSSELVAQLNQIAVDVDEILDGQVPSDVLRQYRDGDKGISVRRLLGKKQSHVGEVRIYEAYQQSASFRAKIDTYIRNFERLLGQANQSDPSKLLYTTFLTGDLGKLYVFLAEALGERKAA